MNIFNHTSFALKLGSVTEITSFNIYFGSPHRKCAVVPTHLTLLQRNNHTGWWEEANLETRRGETRLAEQSEVAPALGCCGPREDGAYTDRLLMNLRGLNPHRSSVRMNELEV